MPSATHPPIGTLIDDGSLELVEVLGVGGYGVVYRAVDTRYPTGPKSYAVKCLVSSGSQSARQRQVHIREIALHQLASAHPGVVVPSPGHRALQPHLYHYGLRSDHDLFTQILHNCRYLGNDALIKDIFLQMLDSVEYCHSLGIYHRDLKPENILCFDDGLRVAITDFGLATTDKLSDEFRTGSVYHMSPECQGGAFAPGGKYSPMFNDIWSLGIILLNLATGRNPWKSATADDPTFQAYLRDPYNFLPTVLPISPEVNDILVQMLDVDWRQRMKLHEIRYAIEQLDTFYSDAGMEIDSSDSSSDHAQDVSPPISPAQEKPLTSQWSKDSTSDIVFAPRSPAEDSAYGVPWPECSSSCAATWAFESPATSVSSEEDHFRMDTFTHSGSSSEASTESPSASLPATPNDFEEVTFAAQQDAAKSRPQPRTRLTLDTNLPKLRIYEASESSYSTEEMMHTAIEYDPYSSLFFLGSPLSAKVGPDSAVTVIGEDKEMTSPSAWRRSVVMSSPSLFSSESADSSDGELVFSRSGTPSPEPWPQNQLHSSAQVQSPISRQCQPSSTFFGNGTMTDSSQRPSPFGNAAAGSSGKKSKPTAAGQATLTANRYLKPTSPLTPIARSPLSPSTPTVESVARRQSQSRLLPQTLPPRAAPPPTESPAPSSSVRPASRGRAHHPNLIQPWSPLGQGQRAKQVVVASSGSSGAFENGSASGCFKFQLLVSGGVVTTAERKTVVGRRNATRQWFGEGSSTRGTVGV
ncbi:kinase-like domain-containing protein [Coprinopsis sp. MPI-PUGE-AT-0042]|nr:kinase-like domain-containing protein [Coprinopsis sp. MPI-PUGE-AT-0042]